VAFLPYLVTSGLAYLLGSIPTGFLLARLMGVDITRAGSGNIGATNAFRVLGKGPGILVLAVDAAKGAAAVLWVPWVAVALCKAGSVWLPACAAVAAVLGHNYTCWLGFKGGKGIATSAGALAALVPPACGVAVVAWIAVFAASRYVSLASIAAALALPVAAAFLPTAAGIRWPMVGLTAALSALAIWRHRPNIRRLLDGTEHRFGRKKGPAA
jgi:glycerol-3-phosphate acyltransferase PlsY